MSQLTDPDELAERVEVGLKRQTRIARAAFAIISAGMLALFSLIAWSMASSVGAEASESVMGAMIMMTVGWGVSVMYQVIGLMLDSPAIQRRTRARIAASMLGEQMVAQAMRGSRSKAKRDEDDAIEDLIDEPMTVGDDGELISEREARRNKGRK